MSGAGRSSTLSPCVGALVGLALVAVGCASRPDAPDALSATEAQPEGKEAALEEARAPGDAAPHRWDADFDRDAEGASDGHGRFAPPPPGQPGADKALGRERWFDGDDAAGPSGGERTGGGVTLGGAVAWRSADDALAELAGLERKLAAAGVAMPALAAQGTVGVTTTATGNVASTPAPELDPKPEPTPDDEAEEAEEPEPPSDSRTRGEPRRETKNRKRKGSRRGQAKKPSAPSDPSGPAAPPASESQRQESGEDGAWCADVCELTRAICTLETRICDMATRYPEDERYGAACERARLDCRVASDACTACSAR